MQRESGSDPLGGRPHEGLLSVDLGAIGDNYDVLRGQLAAASRCGAVVKADAYGLGMERVAPALYRRGCRDFFVATQAEGESLRALLGDEATIVVLTGVRAGFEVACAEAGLIPTLFTPQQVRAWVDSCLQSGIPAPCALKVDTGMTRLGMSEEEFDTLLADPGLLRSANVRLLMSHLACADEPRHPQNRRQLENFQRAGARLRQQLPEVSLSLSNSSGIFLGPEYHFDVARPGCALYGVNPTPDAASPMSAVVELTLPVVQKRLVTRACQVGYGATQSVNAGTWLAVARGGYADGILRAQGGRGCGWASGQRLPMVGRVSMDSATYDISALTPAERDALDNIQVLNRHLTVDEVAEYAGTIGYEILTSLGSRYLRRYLRS